VDLNSVLFIVYLLVAILMGRFVSVPPIDRNQLPFIVACAVVWPLTVVVIGLLCLIFLLAHLYQNWQARKPAPLSAQMRQKV